MSRKLKLLSNDFVYDQAFRRHKTNTGRTVRRIAHWGLGSPDDVFQRNKWVDIDLHVEKKACDILKCMETKKCYAPSLQETRDLNALGFHEASSLLDLTEQQHDRILNLKCRSVHRLYKKIKQIRHECHQIRSLGHWRQHVRIVPYCELKPNEKIILQALSWCNNEKFLPTQEDVANQLTQKIVKREAMGGPCNSISCRRECRREVKAHIRKQLKRARVDYYRHGQEDMDAVEYAAWDAAKELMDESFNVDMDINQDTTTLSDPENGWILI